MRRGRVTRGKRGRRWGGGLLIVLGAALLGVLFVTALCQSRFTSRTTVDVATLMRHDRAILLAESAINEASARLRRGLNDETTPWFEQIRKSVYAGDEGSLELEGPVELSGAAALSEEDPSLASYVLSPVELRVAFQRQLDATAYERCGVIRYRVTVKAPAIGRRRVVRSLEAVQSFKLVLASPPRPACSNGFFLADLDGLVDREEVNDSRRQLIEAAERLRTRVEQLARIAPAEFRQSYAELLAALPSSRDGRRAAALPEAGVQVALYGLQRHGATMDLGRLDLGRELKNKLDGVQESLNAVQACETAARVGGTLDHDEYQEAIQTAGRYIAAGLWRLWAFNKVYKLLPATDEAYPALASSFYTLDGAAWRRRAQWRVKARSGERDTNAAWERFLDSHPGVQGVVIVRNVRKPLRLQGRLQGPLVIVAGPGGVSIEDLESEGGPLTIACLGGPVEVRGKLHGALLLCRDGESEPSSLTIAPGAIIRGCLVARRLPVERNLHGLLCRSNKVCSKHVGSSGQSTLDPTHLHVELSQRFAYRKVLTL